jgi:uncharacterized protein YcbX
MHLSELNIYPVKSLKGISLESAVVEDRGLQYDRRWLLVDRHGRFFTQREVPRMAIVKIEVGPSGMTASANGSGAIGVPHEPATGDIADVTIWNDTVAGEYYPQEIHKWFTDAIGIECRLVRMPETTNRTVSQDHAVRETDIVSFADAYPFLLIGEASLADLNSRLDEPVPMNRFRPNFVVSGPDAFDEDTWKRIRIGSAEFHVVKPCARCVLTTVDQVRGEKTGKEPLKTLSEYRNRDGKVLFGQNLIADNAGGTVRVGDEVEVIETKKAPLLV